MKRCCIKVDKIKGRGVYSLEYIRPGDIIEVCEVILLPESEVGQTLTRFVFGYDKKKVTVALGNGSLYNHARKPNAYCYFEKKKLVFEATKVIRPHEEILINYGYTKAQQKHFKIS